MPRSFAPGLGRRHHRGTQLGDERGRFPSHNPWKASKPIPTSKPNWSPTRANTSRITSTRGAPNSAPNSHAFPRASLQAAVEGPVLDKNGTRNRLGLGIGLHNTPHMSFEGHVVRSLENSRRTVGNQATNRSADE